MAKEERSRQSISNDSQSGVADGEIFDRKATPVRSVENSDGFASTTKLVSTSRAASTPPERPRQNHRHNSDGNTDSITLDKTSLRARLSKKKSQFFEDAFTCRDPCHPGKRKAAKDTAIIVAIKLTLDLKFPHGFLSEFAFLISEIYQKPAGCVTITVNNGPIIFDNSSDPAYQISITALEGEVAATKNRRAAGMIQERISETLGLPSTRGLLVFHSIAEENVITGLVRKSDEAAKQNQSDERGSKDKGKSRESSAALSSDDSASTIRGDTPSFTTIASWVDSDTAATVGTTEVQRMKKKKSFRAFLGF